MGGYTLMGVSRLLNISAALVIAAFLAGCTTEVITTESGQVVGLRLGGTNTVDVFKSIPYAAAPVGDLRWRPPQPAVPWEGVRKCFEYGSACPQPDELDRDSAKALLGGPTSEDCLYLNVWRPTETSRATLPVMVWIHGGGFQTGSSSIYDARKLAAQGVVVVTINYRLGPFGFMAHPALSEESPDKVSGNYGVLDQIAALEWVHDNIAAFDGDPANVTIFGESAGSMSVACLLATPLAQGLFHRAIMESGVPWRLDRLRGDSQAKPTAEEDGLAFAARFGVTGTGPEAAAALRALNADILVAAESERTENDLLPYAPVVDGFMFADQPLVMLRAGDFNRVPLIVGSNQDEGNLFILTEEWLLRLSEETYVERVSGLFGEWADDVLAMYPPIEGEISSQANRLFSDYLMLTPSRMTARAVSKYVPNTYYYYFTKAPSGLLGRILGAFHAAELAYVFDNLIGTSAYTPADRALSKAMQEYWVRFAATGNPNGGDNPVWPAYNVDSDQHIELGPTIAAGSQLLREQVDFFEPILLEWMGS